MVAAPIGSAAEKGHVVLLAGDSLIPAAERQFPSYARQEGRVPYSVTTFC
jgi:hypothetical protein